MKENLHDGGIDLYIAETVTLEAHETKPVKFKPTFILRPRFCGYIIPRSSYRKQGLVAQALYDAGYDQEFMTYITNTSDKAITLEEGVRALQLILLPVVYVDQEYLTNTDYRRKNKRSKADRIAAGILEIKKTWSVRTGHKLTLLEHGHKCLNPHGEYYTIIATFRSYESPENLPGHMLIDFGEIDKVFKTEVYDFLDHSFLIYKDDPNVELYKQLSSRVRVLDFSPTAEYIAKFIFERLVKHIPTLVAVEVIESANNSAIWRVGY